MRAILIMFDGPDGAGKTTQIGLAASELEGQGHEVYRCRINGGSDFGEKLREVILSDTARQPMTEHYVFLAMHTQLRHELAPHLAAGKVVLIDRSPLSDWAYQKFGGSFESAEFEHNIDRSMQLFNPAAVICYTADLSVLRERMALQSAKKDYFDSKPDSYFERVIAGYHFAAKRYRATVISAEPAVAEVHRATMQAIQSVIDQAK
jgi:dTMP kinase